MSPVSIPMASRAAALRHNAIRDILAVAGRPGMISLAGGMPAPECLPIDHLPELLADAVDAYGPRLLQYDATEGFEPLREILAAVVARIGIQAAARDVFIGSGSQSVIDSVGKLFVSPDHPVAVEAPTYLGALQALAPYGPQYVALATDEGGVVPEALEEVLAAGAVKLVYLIPTFQNPTGVTLSLRRRRRIADLLVRYGALLVEDDPYGWLRYRGEPVPPIKTMAPEHVLYVGSLSKIFAPGLRLGFCLPPPELGEWLVLARQGVDLHTNTLGQALAARFFDTGRWERHAGRICSVYAARLDAMLVALQDRLPPGFTWSRPEGGMFVWVTGPAGTDSEALYRRALERGVAFVPGRHFHPVEGRGTRSLRLNFTLGSRECLTEGVARLAAALADESTRPSPHPATSSANRVGSVAWARSSGGTS